MHYNIVQANAIDWLNSLPTDSLDLVFGSPPYEEARLYLEGGANIGIARKTEDWVAWMVEVYRAAQRACKGLVAFVVEGQTRKRRYSCGPVLLMADLHRAGFHVRKPPIFQRFGIPGSGGKDWLRNDYEFIVCAARPGNLPWSDVTACGHPPKWAPGGAMSHRLSSGQRVNQWGKAAGTEYAQRRKGGERQKAERPSHIFSTKGDDDSPTLIDHLERPRGVAPTSGSNGDISTKGYDPPKLANPGNVIRCNVGGGQLGHPLAHKNEAPFPLTLAEFFVKSFCPPGGMVADPFTGSGTTGHAAILHGRNYTGCDLRQSQVDLALRRLATVTPPLPETVAEA